jgi:hypothetical protein
MLRQKSRRYHGYGSYVPHIPIIFQELKQRTVIKLLQLQFFLYISFGLSTTYYSVYYVITSLRFHYGLPLLSQI